MFRNHLSFLLGLILSAPVYSQLKVPMSNAINVDGKVDATEWSASDTATLTTASGKNVDVIYQYDPLYFNVAFLGNLESNGFRFPEILIDANNDRSLTWMPDDWWFHVSATDCEYQGQYGNYDSCQVVRPNWKGVPNFSPGPPGTDTVEIRIPFSTIQVDPLNDTISLSFLVTNTFSIWEHWPSAATRQDPSTWQQMCFSSPSISTPEATISKLTIYPSPAADHLVVSCGSPFAETYILDLSGKIIPVDFQKIDNERIRLDVGDIAPGYYIVRVHSEEGVLSQKLVINH
ncbi:MAG: T9SS type A sorting domain-containing protein [Owenweeksia sp.]